MSRGFCITTYHCGCPHTVSHTSTKTLSWHGAWSVFSTLCTWQELFTAQLWNRKRTFYFLIITFLFCDIHMMSAVVRKQNQFLRSWRPHTTPRIKKGSCPSLNFSAFPNKILVWHLSHVLVSCISTTFPSQWKQVFVVGYITVAAAIYCTVIAVHTKTSLCLLAITTHKCCDFNYVFLILV